MRLQGEVYFESRLTGLAVVPVGEGGESLAKRLDAALLALCKQMNVPIPVWLQNNTKQFAAFHMTLFTPDQFVDRVHFDQFQIRLLSDDRVTKEST